jgi:hypothetical protein
MSIPGVITGAKAFGPVTEIAWPTKSGAIAITAISENIAAIIVAAAGIGSTAIATITEAGGTPGNGGELQRRRTDTACMIAILPIVWRNTDLTIRSQTPMSPIVVVSGAASALIVECTNVVDHFSRLTKRARKFAALFKWQRGGPGLITWNFPFR